MTDITHKQSSLRGRPAFRLLTWWIAAAGIVAALTAVGLTSIGGWVQSFFFGTGTRWEDAYRVFDASQRNVLDDPRERERRLTAWALVDGERPKGEGLGARIHPPPMLARLRYETLDERGERIDGWQVRALIPPLGNGDDPVWKEGCPQECSEELARVRGVRLLRSGEPGIAAEWVLRMPIGRSFDLGSRTLLTHDILDEQPRRISLTSVQEEGRSFNRPANVRVTLMEACAAEVRVGTLARFEVFPNAIVPIPRGFRYTRWVQLNGCGALAPFEPPPSPLRMAVTSVVKVERVPPGAFTVRREPVTGYSALKVDEAWLARYGAPVVIHIGFICRYNAATGRWQRMPSPPARLSNVAAPLSPEDAGKGDRVVMELPREIALFWVHWIERRKDDRSTSSMALREVFVTSGPVLCNDIMPGPAPAGQVTACVPFADHAEARFVPPPEKTCTGAVAK